MKLFENSAARHHLLLIPIALAIVTITVYWQVHEFKFVSFDDRDYVTENEYVKQGISYDSLIWAFNPVKTDTLNYWHPLTSLSHMMDCQMFGLNPGAHHLINLLIHIINVTLLFMAFHLMTGAPWKSAFVAAMFALHPINVDSVAWIAERKNLLSTTFWMFTLLTYMIYARKPGILRYGLVLCSLALGLLAKPMLVTLPFVLLLLDFWPLGRIDLGQQRTIAKKPDSYPVFQPAGITRLIMEKVPFLALSIATIALSLLSLQINNQMVDAASAPMDLRIENAMVSYVAYLWKMIWPVHLAVFYPFPKFIPLWQSLGATLLIIAVTALIFRQARKSPWLATGWLWYLGTLLPVIGLVQGGLWPALADRWGYVPLIGIFIIIAWGVPGLIPHCRLKQTSLELLATALICILSIAAWIQAGYWKNSQTLFEHALKVTTGNYVAHNNLGNIFFRQGRTEDAIFHFTQAIKAKPDHAEAHYNLANALRGLDKNDKAMKHYLQAIAIRPNYEKAFNNLAILLLDQGRTDEAITYFKQALLINPTYAQANFNLANALKNSGRMDEAIQHYLITLKINPSYADAHYALANTLKDQGKLNKAIEHYRQSIDIQPDNEKAHHNLATVLMSQGRIDEAILYYLKALKINPDYVNARYNLGIAYFKTGNITAAAENFETALRLNPGAGYIRVALDQAIKKMNKK